MDSNENQEPHHPPPPPPPPPPSPSPPPPPATPSHPLLSKLKQPIFLLSIFIVICAISLSIVTKTNHYKLHHLKSTLSPNLNPIYKLLQSFHTTHKPIPQKASNFETKPSFCVHWMAPFLSGGGYSSEAWSYMLSLHSYLKNSENPRFQLSIEQHGDLESLDFWEGLPIEMRNLAIELYQSECRVNETIVVCHSEPGAWFPPLFQTLPCPPIGYGQFKVVIGRTMFETDRVNDEHVKRCNRMDFVWVPTKFHVDVFTKSGVDPLKVVKVVQAVDVAFFDPLKYEPLDLGSVGNLVVGSNSREVNLGERFVFLSVFKWEYRKGWDVLLRAYLKEFSMDDNVALYLLTNPYHSDRDFGNKIVEYVEEEEADSGLEMPVNGWAAIYVIDEHIAQVDLPRLYKTADAFVLPSRGEGWGRPLVEAMAMSLPVIATNWSGPTEYLTEENGYPLPVDRLSEVKDGPFKGHLWAEPSVDKLRVLMRRVMSNREEARAKGTRARSEMNNQFSPEIVAEVVADHIHRIIQNAF